MVTPIKGIVFYGSGGLLWYYLGVAQYIQENYYLDDVKLCGASGGSLPSVVLATGLPVRRIWDSCFLPWICCMKQISTPGCIIPVFTDSSISKLTKSLEKVISEEQNHILNTINNKLAIRITKVSFLKLKPVYIEHWDSIKDVVSCSVASCWIPYLFGPASRHYKGSEYIDGQFPNSIEQRGSEWLEIRISTFQNISKRDGCLLYLSSLGTIGNVDVAQKLYDSGYNDASENAEYFRGLRMREK